MRRRLVACSNSPLDLPRVARSLRLAAGGATLPSLSGLPCEQRAGSRAFDAAQGARHTGATRPAEIAHDSPAILRHCRACCVRPQARDRSDAGRIMRRPTWPHGPASATRLSGPHRTSDAPIGHGHRSHSSSRPALTHRRRLRVTCRARSSWGSALRSPAQGSAGLPLKHCGQHEMFGRLPDIRGRFGSIARKRDAHLIVTNCVWVTCRPNLTSLSGRSGDR